MARTGGKPMYERVAPRDSLCAREAVADPATASTSTDWSTLCSIPWSR
eukprot:CAMPEP_0115838210 /NCGR_PEP_ID=MMETSP0287-20121206/5612_1 /TAXON_ID=412157 /ORGANISM="Chrysochromulina rotalis, Strain UIO044" /LENGTH=47 /DNA_ID= /DNA_START= /DNA_END= /DNA_ORIENTATION=